MNSQTPTLWCFKLYKNIDSSMPGTPGKYTTITNNCYGPTPTFKFLWLPEHQQKHTIWKTQEAIRKKKIASASTNIYFILLLWFYSHTEILLLCKQENSFGSRDVKISQWTWLNVLYCALHTIQSSFANLLRALKHKVHTKRGPNIDPWGTSPYVLLYYFYSNKISQWIGLKCSLLPTKPNKIFIEHAWNKKGKPNLNGPKMDPWGTTLYVLLYHFYSTNHIYSVHVILRTVNIRCRCTVEQT